MPFKPPQRRKIKFYAATDFSVWMYSLPQEKLHFHEELSYFLMASKEWKQKNIRLEWLKKKKLQECLHVHERERKCENIFSPTRWIFHPSDTTQQARKKYLCGMGKSIRLDIFPHFSVVYIVWSEKKEFFFFSIHSHWWGAWVEKKILFFYCVSCLPHSSLLFTSIGNCFIFTIENEVFFVLCYMLYI